MINLGDLLGNLGLSMGDQQPYASDQKEWWCLWGCYGDGCQNTGQNVFFCPNGTCHKHGANVYTCDTWYNSRPIYVPKP